MEKLFSIQSKIENNYLYGGTFTMLCALSDDTVAFTSPHDLKLKCENENIPKINDDVAFINLYICDVLEPWYLFLIYRSNENIINLTWNDNDSVKKKLLVVDEGGNFQVWQRKTTMNNILLNDWVCTHTASVSGELIRCAKWFQSGIIRRVKNWRETIKLYDEKYPKIDCKSTVEEAEFSGEAVDGFCAVTASGLFVWCTLSKINNVVNLEKHSPFRSFISVADISFQIDSTFFVAVSDGLSTSPLLTYSVKITYDVSSCSYSTSIRPEISFILNEQKESVFITHLTFLRKLSSSKELAIVTTENNKSCVSFWRIIKKKKKISDIILKAAKSANFGNNLIDVWDCLNVLQCESLISSIAIPQRYNDQQDTVNTFEQIAICEKNGNLNIIGLKDLRLNFVVNIQSLLENPDSNIYLTSIQQSYNGLVLVGLDQFSNLSAYKLIGSWENSVHIPPICMANMLEYCLFREKDSWDVMCCIKPSTTEIISKQINDNFAQQLKPVQGYFAVGIAMLNARLQKILPSSSARPGDFYLYGYLMHYWYLLSRKLYINRQSHIKDNKRPLPDFLLSQIGNNRELDPNNLSLLKDLELRQDVFSNNICALEFVCQLAIQVFFEVANMSNNLTFIHNSPSALCKLRALIFVIRNSLSTDEPFLLRNGIDSQKNGLGRIYTTLTSLWIIRIDNHDISDIDDSILNEMSLIHAHFLTHPPYIPSFFTNKDASCFFNPPLINMEYGDDPIKRNSLFTAQYNYSKSKQLYDCISQNNLGQATPSLTKQCTRCGGYSLIHQENRSYSRWNCICGGQWRRC